MIGLVDDQPRHTSKKMIYINEPHLYDPITMCEDLVFSGVNQAYGRTHTQASIELSETMRRMYHADDCLITVSGMASISTAIQGTILYYAPQETTILYDK